MFDQRCCEKCQGTEFKIIKGAVVTGHGYPIGAAANEDHWFCPDCSWGADGPDDEAA